MLSPSAQWSEEMGHASARVVYRLALMSTATGNTYECVSAASDAYRGYSIALREVDDLSQAVDPLTRKTSIGMTSLVVDDAWVRPLIANSFSLHNARVTLFVSATQSGTPAELQVYQGWVRETRPDGRGETVTLLCDSVLGATKETKAWGAFFQKHPFEIAKSLLNFSASIPTTYINATGWDPNDYVSTWPYGHWAISLGISIEGLTDSDRSSITGGLFGQRTVWSYLDEICALTYSTVWVDETGVIKITVYDSTVAAVAALTVDDIIEFHQEQPIFINRATIKWGSTSYGTFSVGYGAISQDSIRHREIADAADTQRGDGFLSYTYENTSSQTSYGWGSSTKRIELYELSTTLLDQTFAPLAIAIGSGDSPASVRLINTNAAFFCGAGEAGPDQTQDNIRKVSSDRPLYLRIAKWVDSNGTGTTNEILKATSATTWSTTFIAHMMHEEPSGEYLGTAVALQATPRFYTDATISAARAQFGSTALAHTANNEFSPTGSIVEDVTLPLRAAQVRVDRFSHGCPVVKLKLAPRWAILQVNDFINITYPQFLADGYDGITSADKWEIVRKELHLFDDNPHVEIECVWVRSSATGTTVSRSARRHVDQLRGLAVTAQEYHARATQHAQFPITVTQVSGLQIKVARGELVSLTSSMRYVHRKDLTYTCLASRDTYVVLEIATNAILFVDVANGGAFPSGLSKGMHIVLAKVVTNATTVTSIVTDGVSVPLIARKADSDGADVLRNAPLRAPANSFFMRTSRG